MHPPADPLQISAIKDSIQLLQEHLQDLKTNNPHLVPLSLLRIEYRLLYLLRSWDCLTSQESVLVRYRLADLRRVLEPHHELPPRQPFHL